MTYTYYVISEKCIQCGSCAPFCKKEAIDWVNHQYVIDPSKCDRCGTCREYCPIDDVIEEVDSPRTPPMPSLN